MKKITRRSLAASALLPAAAAAQAPEPALTEDPAELLHNARDQVRRNGQILAKAAVGQSVEPAFQFKA
jgi:hypothetical protein